LTTASVYAPAEYCSRAWCQSAYTRKLDSQRNEAMRTISGCKRPTLSDFLLYFLVPCPLLFEGIWRVYSYISKHKAIHETLHVRRASNRLRWRRPLRSFMENLTNHDYSPLQFQILWSHISLVAITLHQDATCRAKHGSNLTACALDAAGLKRTSAEWDWLMTKAVRAETSNPPIVSSITVPCCPVCAASPTPPTKIWLNTFAILPFRSNRIALPPVTCVYTTEKMISCSITCRQEHYSFPVISC